MLLDKTMPFKYLFIYIILIKNEFLRTLIILTTFFIIKSYVESYLPLPIALPAILETSISLLLAFRINQSYNRWWEARRICHKPIL